LFNLNRVKELKAGRGKSLLVINTENICKIKLAKKDGNLLLMTFRTSLFHHLASNFHQLDILILN